ncbi:hypothetical protein HHK36_008462 [Tetracentron sinense]|uniref:Uncharacterized protein n=1 Tax=Tetracentron sinense TaxID=13715 RepID=A0A834ZJ28_TETSI|nr:hypothetical protein HHK36_008462 [Tetracentron sinense]
MELQSVCSWHLGSKNILHNRLSSQQIVSTPFPVWDIRIRDQRVRYGNASTLCLMRGFKTRINDSYLPNLRIRTITGASSSNQDEKLISPGRRISNVPANAFDRSEPFRGKSGSVSFYGLTHQLVEEGKLVSSPFKEGTGSLLWVLAPIALISSLLLPPFFLSNAVDTVLKDEILAEIVASFSSEAMFYIGLAVFLLVTDHVQRPYLDFSPKRWGLITGLKGYITSAFFTMGFKVFAPLFAVYVTWPVLGLPAVVAVAPFLLGCVAQLAFETYLDKRGSSCWPLVTIIFEVYRLYQLSKAAHFIERLMFSMKGAAVSPELLERSGALVGMLVSFQILGVVCLWSLMTFLLRLFPSRPVAENY